MLIRIWRTAALLSLVLCAHAAQPWDQPFATDVQSAVEAAKRVAVPEDQTVVVLLEDHRYSIDAQGRTASTIRKVYRIIKQDAVDDWASVEQEYQPWYQQTPQIRARVISGDGIAHWLDEKTIADSPAREFDSSIFSDRRVLRAPLPAVAAGALVEYQISIAEKAPLLDAGTTWRITVNDSVPLQRFHVVVEAAKTAELRTSSRLIPESAIRREATRAGLRVECELGPQEVRKNFEFDLPPDVPQYPYFSFSTGKSWQAVAARYASIVDEQIRSASVQTMLDGVDLKGAPEAVAARLVAKLHAKIRYTGVEFGEAAIVPAKPSETLSRGYGDCKDKSALLTAMLRAAGLDASLALLASGFGTDTDPDVPGLGIFDHAIVYVASNPPLWIDATAADTRVGVLPSGDQGRLALIARREITALVKTPESASQDNWERHTIEVRLSEYGPGEFTETIESGGVKEATLRALYASDKAGNKERLESYAKQNYAAKLTGFEVSRKDDWDAPFRIIVRGDHAGVVSTGMDDAGVALTPYVLFQELPFALTLPEDEADAKKRQHDFLMPEPYRIEYKYRLIAPALFKPVSLPASAELALGPAIYTKSFRTAADGTVEAIYRLETGKRRLTRDEFAAFREGASQHSKRAPEVIAFVPATSEYIAMGQMSKALALVRDFVAGHAGQAAAHVRFARMLVGAGLGAGALAEAKKAIELDDKSSQAWQALGWVYQHDTFGRRFRGNWNLAEAEKTYRKAIEIAPDDWAARTDLAILLEHNQSGFRYGAEAKLDEAIALYREIIKKQQTPMLAQNVAIALLYSGKLDETREQLKKCSPEVQALLGAIVTAQKDGPAQAIVNTQTAFPDPAMRAQQLTGIAFTLVHMRRYDLARPIMAAAARLAGRADLQTRAELLEKLKRYDETLLPETDPRSPVQRMFLELFLGHLDQARLKPLFTSGQDWSNWDQGAGKIRGMKAMVQHQFASIGLTDENLADFLLSLLDLQKDGEESRGYRIRVSAPGTSSFPSMYVVQEDGRYRILGSRDSFELVGQRVLDLVEKNDIKGAQWWLDKINEDFAAADDGTGFPAARSLWSGIKPETRGPAAITLAAASLIGRYSVSERALRMLREGRPKAANDLERAQIDKALCETLNKAQKWDELLVVAKRLSASRTFPEEGFRYAIKAAASSKRWKELQALAQQRLQSNPANLTAMRALVIAKARLGDQTGADEWIRKISASSMASSDEHIFEAWNAMMQGNASQDLLTKLKQDRDRASGAKFHYTLATLQALLKMPEDAQQSLNQALEQEDFDSLDARAWVAYGKICEAYGASEDAAAAFDRARTAAHDDETAEWALSLIPQ